MTPPAAPLDLFAADEDANDTQEQKALPVEEPPRRMPSVPPRPSPRTPPIVAPAQASGPRLSGPVSSPISSGPKGPLSAGPVSSGPVSNRPASNVPAGSSGVLPGRLNAPASGPISSGPASIAPVTTVAKPSRNLSPRASAFAGAVIGAAIGDALGHPTESLESIAAIRKQFGPNGVVGYALYREKDGVRYAPYTDDTQMAEIVLDSLIGATDLDATMQDLAARFVEWKNAPQGGHRSPGKACIAGCEALERGIPWHSAGAPDAGGSGSVMRAYPFGLVFAHDPAKAELWAVEHSRLTHRAPMALAACAAMAVGVAHIARGASLVRAFSEMVGAACRYDAKTAAMMATALDEARSNVEPTITLERLRGHAAHEAIAAAIYIATRHAKHIPGALLEAVNTPGDSDTIATLVGALLGARHGFSALPTPWVDELERTDALFILAVRASQSES